MSKNEWVDKIREKCYIVQWWLQFCSSFASIILTRIQSERASEKIKKGTSGTTKEWRRGAHLQIQYRLLTQPSALTSERRQQQREWLLHWAEAGNHAAQIKSQNTEREREKDLLLSNCWLLLLRMPFLCLLLLLLLLLPTKNRESNLMNKDDECD